jgi:uncharacterized protein YdaU (DUF1376 family)
MSPPYMPLYVADYLSATEHLDAAQSGAYLHLLMYYWQKGGLPHEDKFLARIARMGFKQWLSAKPTIKAFFNEDWTHDRAAREIDKANAKAEMRASCGKRGGDAKALKYKETDLAKAIDLPEQTASKPHSKIPSNPLPSSSGLGILRIIDADASIVDEGVDPTDVRIKKPEKTDLREALRSLGEQWNQLAGSFRLPTIDEIKAGSTRERHALARLREHPDDVPALMARIRGSPLLRGEVNDFRCTFDWIVNASNYQKIMDGNYEDRKVSQLRR